LWIVEGSEEYWPKTSLTPETIVARDRAPWAEGGGQVAPGGVAVKDPEHAGKDEAWFAGRSTER
jgi:hypothetical protein